MSDTRKFYRGDDDAPHTSDVLCVYWELRKERSLKKALNRKSALELHAAILAWSARNRRRFGQNAGKWVTDMEFVCWDRCPSLRRLAYKAGGWWVWNDGQVFVTSGEWSRLHSAHMRAREVGEAQQRFARLAGRDERSRRERDKRYYREFVPNVTKRHAEALAKARRERLAGYGITENVKP